MTFSYNHVWDGNGHFGTLKLQFYACFPGSEASVRLRAWLDNQIGVGKIGLNKVIWGSTKGAICYLEQFSVKWHIGVQVTLFCPASSIRNA